MSEDTPYLKSNSVERVTEDLYYGRSVLGNSNASGIQVNDLEGGNVFTSNASVDGDTSYMGIMASNSDGGSSGITYMPEFSLANTYGIQLSFPQQTTTTAKTKSNKEKTSKTTQKTDVKFGRFDLAHTSGEQVIFEQSASGSSTDTVSSGFTGYKLKKDSDGKYKPTFYENGKTITQAEFMVKHKKEYSACKQELETKNKV